MKVTRAQEEKTSLVTGLRDRCYVSSRVNWGLMRLHACPVPLRSPTRISSPDPDIQRSDGAWMLTEKPSWVRQPFHRVQTGGEMSDKMRLASGTAMSRFSSEIWVRG